MSNNPLISVIIPIYNAELYMKECLNSLKLQVYKNLEFICVNDGSSDNSLDILNEFQAKDNRFKIITQENLGASAARNKGLEFANGSFISFIDADDRVSLSLYQKFVDLQKKPEIYLFNVAEYNRETKNILPNYFFSLHEWNNHKDENTWHVFNDNANPFKGNMSAINKIYAQDFIARLCEFENTTKLFPEGCIFEDQYFFFLTMLNTNSILINPDPLYYYRLTNQNSVTKTLSNKVFDIFKIIDKIEDLFIRTNTYEEYKYALFQHKYKQFSHLFFKAEESLREAFYAEMKNRLLKYENEGLNQQICSKMTMYNIYCNILKFECNEFYEQYKNKLS